MTAWGASVWAFWEACTRESWELSVLGASVWAARELQLRNLRQRELRKLQ